MPPQAQRRADIDWLRVVAVYLLLAFHSAKVFDRGPWHVKNSVENDALQVFTGATHTWHMPLLFVLAGWSAAASLHRRGAGGMLLERRDRLLVPFAFGSVALIPPVAYVALRHAGKVEENFVAFVPGFFTDLDRFTWMHLWFLIYLLAFTLLYLPTFLWIRRRRWRVERVPPWAVYASIAPFAAVQISLRGRWPGYQNLYDDWANFTYYSLFFIAGFLLMRFPAIEDAIHRERPRLACIGLAALVGMAVVGPGLQSPAQGTTRWSAFQALSGVSGVCFVGAILGYGRAYLASSTRRLAYFQHAAMPVYLLHQPIIIALAVPLVGIRAPVPLKFGLLLGVAGAATLAAHHLVVRRSRILRVLLGTKRAGEPDRARFDAADGHAGHRGRTPRNLCDRRLNCGWRGPSRLL